MADPTVICTGEARIVGKGKDARLQQKWQVHNGGTCVEEWRDVPTVEDEALDHGSEPQENVQGP